MVNKTYNLNININSINASVACDRSLNSNYDRYYDVLELEDQIKEMKLYL